MPHVLLNHPVVEKLRRVGGGPWIGPPHLVILFANFIEQLQRGCSEAGYVVVIRHTSIPAVAGDMDVFDARVERQPVERQM